MLTGEKVRHLMAQRGWGVEELASRVRAAGAANVRYQHIQQLLDIPTRSPRYFLELAKAFGMSAERFSAWEPTDDRGPLEIEGTPSGARSQVLGFFEADVPMVDDVVRVLPIEVERAQGEKPASWSVSLRHELSLAFWPRTLAAFGLGAAHTVWCYMHDDSMSPRVENQDILLVATNVRRIENGSVCALLLNDKVLVRRLYRNDGSGITLRADNALRYEALEIPHERLGDLQVIGPVRLIAGALKAVAVPRFDADNTTWIVD